MRLRCQLINALIKRLNFKKPLILNLYENLDIDWRFKKVPEFDRSHISNIIPKSNFLFSYPNRKTRPVLHAICILVMSTYLPLPILITQMPEIQSTFQFVSDSPYTRYILKWYALIVLVQLQTLRWYLCANTKDCLAPNDSKVTCKLHDFHDHKRTFMNCHRFDQAYWNIAALAYLFGDRRGALDLGYADEDWTRLTENIVVQVDNSRNSAMGKFFKLVSIKRGDEIKEMLILKCKS